MLRSSDLVRNQALREAKAARIDATRAQSELQAAGVGLKRLERQIAGGTMLTKSLRAEISDLRAALEERPELLVNDTRVLGWLLEGVGPRTVGPKAGSLGWCGSGPYADDVLDPALREIGFRLYDLAHNSISHVVVGRTDWSENALLEQIDLRQGKALRVYSQEMLIAMLLTGKDPLDSDDEDLLDSFKAGHPALEFLAGEYFRWPSVTVPDTRSVPLLDSRDLGVAESPLHVMGYRVGATSSLVASERREVLRRAFEHDLPFVDSREYMAKWGTRRSHQRLWRIAIHIVNLLNGHVGRDYRKPESRRDWLGDLRWLKSAFYDPRRFKFRWPDVQVL
jgi:hypothetical protein